MINKDMGNGNKKIDGIILAAGLSRRAGTYKMTLRINGKPLLERCIENMYDICSKIIVVGGYKIEDIRSIVDKYEKAKLVINENYNEGMFSSIKKGLTHIKEGRFFLTPGDYPAIQHEVYKNMSVMNGDIIIPTYQGKRGHPVLISSNLINDILTDTETRYSNLREFINERGYTTIEVRDKGILMDVDTMIDYDKICSYLS